MQLSGRGVVVTWLVSIAAHALLFLIMFMVPWLASAVQENKFVVPHAEIIGDVKATVFHDTEHPDLSEQMRITEPQDVKFKPNRFTDLAEIGEVDKPDLSVIAIGAGGGDFSKFGLKGGDDSAPTFFGQRAQGARRVVYVVDKSGSMIETFQYVRDELIRSVGALRRSQKFHVIFFSDGPPLENKPRRLVSAIENQKQQLYDFLNNDVTIGGRTEPGSAMVRAFDVEPDLIYLLTDGEFDRGLLKTLDRLNQDRRVRIFTIAYFNRDGAKLLEEIAREHRGEFTQITENNLP